MAPASAFASTRCARSGACLGNTAPSSLCSAFAVFFKSAWPFFPVTVLTPARFIVLLMVGTLSYSAVETWKKAIKRRAEEFKRDDSLSARGAPSALSTTVASVRSARGVSASPLAASWRPASDSGAIGALKLPTPAQQRSPILFVASKAERHVPAMRLPGAGSASVSALGGSVTPLSMSATALAQSESSSTVVSGNSRSDASIAVSEAVERCASIVL